MYHSFIGQCRRTIIFVTSQHLTEVDVKDGTCENIATYTIPCHLYDTRTRDARVAAS